MRCAPVAIARCNDPGQLVRDSASTCAVTHYSLTCQWSCIIVNAVIYQFLNGVQPDMSALLNAAKDDGCPDLREIARRDGIPSAMLEAIVAGETPPAGTEWLLRDHGLIGHTLLAMQFGLWGCCHTPQLRGRIGSVSGRRRGHRYERCRGRRSLRRALWSVVHPAALAGLHPPTAANRISGRRVGFPIVGLGEVPRQFLPVAVQPGHVQSDPFQRLPDGAFGGGRGMVFKERRHVVTLLVGRERVGDGHEAHQSEPAAAVPPVEFVPTGLSKTPRPDRGPGYLPPLPTPRKSCPVVARHR